MSRREIVTHLSLLLLISAILYGVANYMGRQKEKAEAEVPVIAQDSSMFEDYYEGLAFQKFISDSVFASVESDTMPAQAGEDAADDPAIWINPQDPALSTVIVTNKKGGMAVYDLQGKTLQYLAGDEYNNVDVRSRLTMGNETIELVVASNRTKNAITFFRIDENSRQISQFGPHYMLDTAVMDDVYGICLGRDLRRKKDYVIVNAKNGNVIQFELKASPDSMILTSKRRFSLPSQPEGMAVDDELGFLYIGEEASGVWKYSLNPRDTSASLLAGSDSSNPNILPDIEGIAIYYAAKGQGYLIVSSQGNFSYALFERSGENKYLGSFKVSNGPKIDGVEETDGLEVCNLNLGPAFPNGLLVLQDGYNFHEGRLSSQNVKFIAWDAVVSSVRGAKLLVDNSFRVR
jgi:3-phytase